MKKVNVKNNVITYVTPKKIETPKQSIKKEEFKSVLDNHELRSKNSSKKDVAKKDNEQQTLETTNKENPDKISNENQSAEANKTTVEGSTEKELDNSSDTSKVNVEIINLIQDSIDLLKQNTEKLPKELVGDANNIEVTEIIDLLETSIDTLKQNTEKLPKELAFTDESDDEMVQIQQLLQLLSSMFQSVDETSETIQQDNDTNSINLVGAMFKEKLSYSEQPIVPEKLTGEGQLIGTKGLMNTEKLIPETKNILKNNLSEIVGLLEKSKGNNEMKSQILNVLQKLTSQVQQVKEDLNLLKAPNFQAVSPNSEDTSIKDNLLKMVSSQSTNTASETITKNQMQSTSDNQKDSKSSGNSSFEDKFLKNLLGENKEDSKISKAVSFMNQFETIKTVDTVKVQTPNLVIDKKNFGADIIKSVKFMEINNIKDLIVKMNPKELGEITIKLTLESGIMKANISAQNKDTFNLLNNNFQDISDRLKNMDIKIQNLDINIYEDSTFFNKDSNQKNSNQGQNDNRGTNMVLGDEDISIINNYAIEENQVNEFV
ncbi:MAG: flagellar hook-length control protein FliK [Clostridium sp.]